ncbi:hypothetical protein J3A83DRAFT_4188045 [Scleroderma citrinum]
MDLSLSKREALDHVQSIVEEAGLSPCDLESISAPSPPHSLPHTSILPPSPSVPHPAILSSNHILLSCLCREPHKIPLVLSTLCSVCYCEIPTNQIIACFQYFLGNTHDSHFGIIRDLLCDKSDKPVRCDKLRISCKGLKVCSEHDPEILNIMHSFKVVFEKTLALYSVLHQQWCSFHVLNEATQENNYHLNKGLGLDLDSDLDLDLNSDSDSDLGTDMDNLNVDSIDCSHLGLHADFDTILQHFRNAWQHQSSPHAVCSSRMILKQDYFNCHFVQCKYQTCHNWQSHLTIHNLQEYDIDYLRALLENDKAAIHSSEIAAK